MSPLPSTFQARIDVSVKPKLRAAAGVYALWIFCPHIFFFGCKLLALKCRALGWSAYKCKPWITLALLWSKRQKNSAAIFTEITTCLLEIIHRQCREQFHVRTMEMCIDTSTRGFLTQLASIPALMRRTALLFAFLLSRDKNRKYSNVWKAGTSAAVSKNNFLPTLINSA